MDFADLFLKREICPLCRMSVKQATYLFEVRQLEFVVRILKCPVCGLAYKEYKPAPKLLELIYDKEYTHYAPNTKKMTHASLERIKRMGKPAGRKHLDYGCGNGSLVLNARAIGWDSYGADPFLPAYLLKTNENYFAHYSTESGNLLPNGPFDVISLWAVVEHMENPLLTFKGLVRNLSKGGKFYFNVPNANSIIARRNGACWGMALLCEHTIFFTDKTVGWLANELGLETVTCRKCGSPYPFGAKSPSWYSFGLNNHFFKVYAEKVNDSKNSPSLKTTSYTIRVRKLLNYPLFGKIARFILGFLGIGDHFYIVYRYNQQ